MSTLKKQVIEASGKSDHTVCCPFCDFSVRPLAFSPDEACPHLMYISWEQDFYFLNEEVSRQLPQKLFCEGFDPEVNPLRVREIGGIETIISGLSLTEHRLFEIRTPGDVGFIGFSDGSHV